MVLRFFRFFLTIYYHCCNLLLVISLSQKNQGYANKKIRYHALSSGVNGWLVAFTLHPG
jgi:hypothetical protein